MALKCDPCAVYAGDLDAEAELFKALADPHRLRILATLARASDDVCVCDLTAGLPLLQPTVSHHLRVLKEAHLVTSERRGTWVYYRLHPKAPARLQAVLELVARPLSKRKLKRAV